MSLFKRFESRATNIRSPAKICLLTGRGWLFSELKQAILLRLLPPLRTVRHERVKIEEHAWTLTPRIGIAKRVVRTKVLAKRQRPRRPLNVRQIIPGLPKARN
jgi:hypothetical protein